MANIFAQYAQAPKSVMDYRAEMDQADMRKNQLQQSAMALQQGQMGLDQTRQTMAAGTAKNNALQQMFADPAINSIEAREAAMLRNPLLMQDGMAARTARLAQEKTSADTAESTAKTAGLTQTQARERKQQAIQHIASLTDSAAAMSQLNSDPDVPQQVKDSLLRSMPQNDPMAFKDWQLRIVLALAKPDEQVKAMAPDVKMQNAGGAFVPVQMNTLAGPVGAMRGIAPVPITQSADNAATNARAAAEGSANRGVQLRGQNMTDNRTRESTSVSMSKPFEVTGQDGQPTLVQQDRQGNITPVQGYTPKTAALKALPPNVNTAIIENAQSLYTLDKALKLNSGENVDSAKGDKEATGWKGYLPNNLLNRIDPSGVSARAEIADIGSLKIHDRSGAAVTISESPRLMPFIPVSTDDQKTVKKKLSRLFEEAQRMQTGLSETYSKDQGYRENPVLKNAAAAAPAASNVVTTPDGVPHTFPNPAAAAAFKKAAGL